MLLLVVGYILELVGGGAGGQHGEEERGARALHCGASHPHRIHMTSTRAHSTTHSSMGALRRSHLAGYGHGAPVERDSSSGERGTRAAARGTGARECRAAAAHPPRSPAAAVTLRESSAQ